MASSAETQDQIRPSTCELRTRTGRRLDPFAPVADDIDVRDIAHALAQQCRFGGHTSAFFSVAQHSVMVSNRAGAIDPDAALWGLLHDASEAYLLDVPRPLKMTPAFAPYRLAEAYLQGTIYARFGLVGTPPPAVTIADDDQLAVEFRDLMPVLPGDGWTAEAGGMAPLRPMSALEAEGAFLIRYLELVDWRLR